MKRKLFMLLFIIALAYPQIDGEVVHNVQASQRTDGSKILDVTYDLYYNELYTSYDVNISIQGDWPLTEPFYLDNCFGDVFFNVSYTGITKEASCYMTDQFLDQVLSGDYYINVHANGYAASEIPDSFEFISYESTYSPGTGYYDHDGPCEDFDQMEDQGAFVFNIFDCNPLYEINDDGYINTDGISALFGCESEITRPRFELMKYEVTAAQYAQFIMDLLDDAISVENSDFEQNGEIVINRNYVFEDGRQLLLYYSSGSYESGIYENNVWENENTFIYPDYTPLNNSGQVYWVNFQHIDENSPYPQISAATSDVGAEDLSVFVSPGQADQPVVNVSFEGARAFAHYYGLRLPSIDEMVQASFPIGIDINDLITGDFYECNDVNTYNGCGALSMVDVDDSEYETLPGIYVHHIIGNAAELTYTEDGRIAFMGQSALEANQFGGFEDCDEFYNTPLNSIYDNYYELFVGMTGQDGSGGIYNEFDSDSMHRSIGFRCARTLPNNE